MEFFVFKSGVKKKNLSTVVEKQYKIYKISCDIYSNCVYINNNNCKYSVITILSEYLQLEDIDISNFLEKISSPSHSIVFLYFFALITEEAFLIIRGLI